MNIAFLGTGRMGTELIIRLVAAGHSVSVWNRTRSKTDRACAAGASWADSPAAAIAGSDVVMTCLFGPDSVRELILEGNILPQGCIWADVTTISPADARRQSDWANLRSVRFVHAPVVGTLAPRTCRNVGCLRWFRRRRSPRTHRFRR